MSGFITGFVSALGGIAGWEATKWLIRRRDSNSQQPERPPVDHLPHDHRWAQRTFYGRNDTERCMVCGRTRVIR